MVLLAITTTGLEDALRLATDPAASVWCGADAISEAEYQARGIPRLSRFIYPLQGASREVLEDALDTIREHHPGEIVWVEGA
jgi:hypothetical protein